MKEASVKKRSNVHILCVITVMVLRQEGSICPYFGLQWKHSSSVSCSHLLITQSLVQKCKNILGVQANSKGYRQYHAKNDQIFIYPLQCNKSLLLVVACNQLRHREALCIWQS